MPISKSELASIVEDLKLLPETMRVQAEMLVGKGCTLRRVDGGLEVVSESGSVIADFAAGCVRDKQAPPPGGLGERGPPPDYDQEASGECCIFFGNQLWR